jgi:hypothetical protein
MTYQVEGDGPRGRTLRGEFETLTDALKLARELEARDGTRVLIYKPRECVYDTGSHHWQLESAITVKRP